MYLKRIELVGFKSFADRTKLEFEPGMTAIVGPNGCGKSNVSDAIRWVLGEQSAKALRGSAMTDVIFNGTDERKPLGMAEISITLADCEEALGTEFNEVTVTRRVLRSGEGQYFVNRTPCRLKDIHRLFMDTGIGTNSYSLMEQGRIDRILSSRPDDRREVFEEASGITKYKADKKEAIRKLEHTEANLLRLADIIREVKRQIISLQRQAGKARRYKTLQEQLRGFDIYVSRERLGELDKAIEVLQNKLASISEQDEALRADIDRLELTAREAREELARVEQEIASAMDAEVQAKTELDRSRQLIQVNTERIAEFRTLSERDSKDAENAKARLQEHRTALETLTTQIAEAARARKEAEKNLEGVAARLSEGENKVETERTEIENLRAESVDLESKSAHLQNELSDLEAQERGTVVRRERLNAERSELHRAVEIYAQRQERTQTRLNELRADVERKEALFKDITEKRAAQKDQSEQLRLSLNELETELARRKAQIEMLTSKDAEDEAYPAGAKLLLNPPPDFKLDRSAILGALAEQIQASPEYRTALEAVLRTWLDAIVVRNDKAARDLLSEIEKRAEGPARLLAANTAVAACPITPEGAGDRLVDHVTCTDDVRPLIERLLHDVRVVDSFVDVPYPVLPGITYVTRRGAILRGDGSAEFWMPESQTGNPLTRRHLLDEWQQAADDCGKKIELRRETLTKLENADMTDAEALEEARRVLEDSRRQFAVCEGEHQVIAEEARQARERQETVEWELNALNEQEGTGDSRRTEILDELDRIRNRQSDIRASVRTKSDQLRELEHIRSDLLSEVTEARVLAAERRQHMEHLSARGQPLEAQIASLEAVISERAEGLSSYQSRIDELDVSIADAQKRLEPLENDVKLHGQRLEDARQRRATKNVERTQADEELGQKRDVLEEIRSRKSEIDVQLAQQRMRRQNMLERITSEYRISAEQIASEPEPEWENGAKPDRDQLETMVAEIRAKLESIGPVNLVAIEEHQELEERYAFLTQQQDDLVKAKQQLMDLIRHINKTTTEMFSQTFNQVNENFQSMFKQLFGGGSAKLVLVDEEDVLESGIEIIARPPGKKLQTVSLLSGGERTLTAVALLFALYMVKPSPFCVLDELDAALDDSNIGRFVKTVEGFLTRSQFIVITHNRQTISAADMLYGVTMETRGVSKIVSVKFADYEKGEGKITFAPAR